MSFFEAVEATELSSRLSGVADTLLGSFRAADFPCYY